MDTNRLRYFCVIAKAGSLARASETLGLSSAALSKAVRLLEEEIGFDLIVPSGRGITITQEGQRLAQKGSEILQQIDQLTHFAAKGLKQQNLLRIGSFEVFTTYLMGEIAEEFAETHEMMVHELVPGKMEEALLDERIDVGLTYQPILHQDLDHLPIGKVKMGVYGMKSKFSEKDLVDLPFAVPVEPLQGVPTKAQGLDGWQPGFGTRKISYRVTMMETALELARRGLAVAYLPSFVVELHNRFVSPAHRLSEVYIPSKGPRTNAVYLVKRKREIENAGMKKLARAVRRNLSQTT